MHQERRSFLRQVMETAWGLFRAEQGGPSPRTFADALAGAWRWMKGRAARQVEAARFMRRAGRGVSFGTMVQSPIRRNLNGQVYANDRARSAGYVTSVMGR